MSDKELQTNLDAVFASHPTAKVVYSTPDGQLFLERRYADAHAGYQKAQEVKEHARPEAEAVAEVVEKPAAKKAPKEAAPAPATETDTDPANPEIE